MENLEKMKNEIQNDPILKEKIDAEAKRMIEAGEAADQQDALVKAVKNILDIDLSDVDPDSVKNELGPEEMEKVAGGTVGGPTGSFESYCEKCPFDEKKHKWVLTGKSEEHGLFFFWSVREYEIRCAYCGKLGWTTRKDSPY